MIPRDRDPRGELRALTARLARLLASDTGTLALAQLQRSTLLAGPRAEPAVFDPGLRIGIWTPAIRERRAVEFVRNRAFAHEWRYWADVDRIPAKSGRRVVLLGESVARGYLFDPAVTPAAILSAMLGGVEVVDLARTDLGLDGLRSMLEGLPALEPDAIVLFAGNNWFNVVFDLDDLRRLADAVRRDGYAGCQRLFLDQILPSRCRAALDHLARSAREFDLPVVVIVPEFNLADWRGEPAVGAPVLTGDANLRWLAARQAAHDALEQGDDEEAARQAHQLIALDGGTSAAGPTVLAAARPDEARLWLERARDAAVGILIAHSPRCPAVVQEVLREQAAVHGFGLVDLPRVLEAATGGAVPGRELFLDYCHLTLGGMRVAMAAAAREVAPLIGAAAQPDAVPGVEPEQEATAHFLAAIHNAHYGQSDEILRHHCAKAAALSGPTRDHMHAYLDSAARWTETWMSESFARLCESPMARRYLLAPEVRSHKLADYRLMDAVVAALEAEGIDVRDEVARLLKQEHGASNRVDLLDPRYRAFTFRDRGGYALAAERGYVRAGDTTSAFALIRREAGRVELRMTGRCRSRGGVAVRVNGREAGVMPVEPVWRTSRLMVIVEEGLNWIELEWPRAAPHGRGRASRDYVLQCRQHELLDHALSIGPGSCA